MSNERVKELAIQLKQSQDPTSKYSPPLTVLKAVAGLPDSAITVQILVATQIGKVVNGLKSDESKTKWGEETAVLAKQVSEGGRQRERERCEAREVTSLA